MQAGETCDRVTVRWSGGGYVRAATQRRDACATRGTKASRVLTLVTSLAACGVLTACSPRIGGSSGVDSANDALRAERESLKEQLRAAELARDEWRAKAEGLAQHESSDVQRLLAAIPAVVRIEIDPRSRIESPDDHPATLSASFTPLDGRGRFTPLVGGLTWRLTSKTSESDDARVLADGTMDAADVREAYRSSFVGTRYVIKETLAPGGVVPAHGDSVVLSVVFTDAATGRKVHADGPVRGTPTK